MASASKKMKIKKGDTVVVISGRDKGSKGEVLHVIPQDSRLMVQGVNVVTKHNKPSQANPQGGMSKMERSIHVSNVAVVDPKTGSPSRVGYKIEKDGTKTRVARKSGQAVE
jgi:large subunit ribosomal protein L24